MVLKFDMKLVNPIKVVINNNSKECELNITVGEKNLSRKVTITESTTNHTIPQNFVNSLRSNFDKSFNIILQPNDTHKLATSIMDIFKRNYDRDLMLSIWSEEIIINNTGLLDFNINSDISMLKKPLNYGVEPGVSYITVEDFRSEATVWAVRPIKMNNGMNKCYVLNEEYRNNEFPAMLFQPINIVPVNIMVGLLDTFNDNHKRDLKGLYKVTIEKIEE